MADDTPSEFFRQVSFNNGELDPLMRARRDLRNYYASLETGRNIVTTPAGPAQQRPGTTFIDYARFQVTLIPLADATLAAPNGGDVADLTEGDPDQMETGALGAGDLVVLTITFATAKQVSMVDLVDYAVKAAAAPTPAPPPFTYPFPQDPDPFIQINPGDINVNLP